MRMTVSCSKHFYEDIMRYDTRTRRWDGGFDRVPFTGRAYHTAVLVGRMIWVIGGCNQERTLGDAWVFDTDDLSWEEVQLQCAPHPHARTGTEHPA